jgi:UDP-N-acetylglucosamine acyltransferase
VPAQTQISKKACIETNVKIGLFSIIEPEVKIGKGTVIGDNVIVRNGSVIGRYNMIKSGVQIGIEPQDYHYQGERSFCVIGDHNLIREYATISCATGADAVTAIGNRNFIMTYVHVAHNVVIGDDTIIASGSQLGGHVMIGNGANIGGLCGIHQFCRIGRMAMLGAKSYLNKDLAPFLLASGNRARIFGVNVKGLKKNGFTSSEIEAIKMIYRRMFYAFDSTEKTLADFGQQAQDVLVSEILNFFSTTKRGILLKRLS